MTLKNGEHISLPKADLDAALQYSSSYGLPGLVDWIKV
jgi:hypothetical protein